MKPQEARVFIIEDSASKLERLTEFIEANGGEVVGSVSTRKDGHRVMEDTDFPASVGNSNTVLIDGNLDERGRHGTDGKGIFLNGYRKGRLHRVDANEGIGAVALGCSIDDRSEVVHETGGNVGTMVGVDESSTRWAELLALHPVEPVYLGEGVIERMDWSDGFQFGEMINYVIKAKSKTTVTIHSLSVVETKINGVEVNVTYSDEVTNGTEMSKYDFVRRAGDWQGVENDYIKVDSHIVKAVVQEGDHLYVINHSGKVRKDSLGSKLSNGGRTDKIAIASLMSIPDTYWKNIDIERPFI